MWGKVVFESLVARFEVLRVLDRGERGFATARGRETE